MKISAINFLQMFDFKYEYLCYQNKHISICNQEQAIAYCPLKFPDVIFIFK